MVILVDKSLFSREAVLATVYRFSGDYNVSVESSNDSEDKYAVNITRKDQKEIDAEFEQGFIRELTDQQVRLYLEARFGHIRDLIVEEAFKPVTKG